MKTIVHVAIAVALLAWCAAGFGAAPAAYAVQRSALTASDGAPPRLTLPTEPPAETQPLAQAALLASLGFVVGTGVLLIVYVRLRERPARRHKRGLEESVGWR